MYENKKILILGAAKSGVAVAKLLAGKNNEITLSELKELDDNTHKDLVDLGINIIIGENQVDLINESYDLIIKNPAIMYVSDIVAKVNALDIPMENEMEVAYHFLPENVKIIGVTGSNGKTTTTTIIYELLHRAGLPVVLGGNIGTPLAALVNDIKSGDIILLEISDHQLIEVKDFKTDISVLTNICPTHLDYHGSYEHYMWTKKKIFNRHTENDLAIINKGNADSIKVTEDIPSKKVYFRDVYHFFDETSIYMDGEKLLDLNDIKLKGIHNYENILAALLVVKEFNVDKNIIKEFLHDFGGVEHRLEFVREFNGIKFYNDSKATNPTATITALKTFQEPIRLILGGLERNQDFNELNDYMEYVKCIYAIGSVTDRIKEYADTRNIPCVCCYKLETAMEHIKKDMEKNEVVLLSTASSSQDQYVRFEDRGEEFKNFVAKL